MALAPHNEFVMVEKPNPSDTCHLDDLKETTSDAVGQRQSFYSTKTTLTNVSTKQEEHSSSNSEEKDNNCVLSQQKSLALNRFLGYTAVNLPTQDPDHTSFDIGKASNNRTGSHSLNKVDITLMIILGVGSMYLIVTSALATPILRISSLSAHKYNDSSLSEAKLNLAGTWDVKLMIQNLEMWKGSYRVTNCTLYLQIERRHYYEEEARNLILAAKSNGIAKESFSLKPKEEKELKLRMIDVGTREERWDSTSFALFVSVHVAFGQSNNAGLASGMAHYECGGLTIDRETYMLSNDVPIFCQLTVPLFD